MPNQKRSKGSETPYIRMRIIAAEGIMAIEPISFIIGTGLLSFLGRKVID